MMGSCRERLWTLVASLLLDVELALASSTAALLGQGHGAHGARLVHGASELWRLRQPWASREPTSR